MTLDQAFIKLDNLNLEHDQHVAVMKLIGAYGRAEYSRGYEASTKLTRELNEKY